MMNSIHINNRLMQLLPEEVRLMQKAKSGDSSAFIRLYDTYVERVHRYIYFQVVDDRAAKGITFQVFFAAWKQLDGYKGIGLPFLSWLYSIAQTQVNKYHSTHRNTESSDDGFVIYKGYDLEEEAQSIREALQFLSEEERQVLILKFIVCMPVQKISRLLSMRVSKIRSLQVRALPMLTACLDEKEIIKAGSKRFQKILAECQVRLLNGTSTLGKLLERYPQDADQLEPLLRTVISLNLVRVISPAPSFITYTREALLHFMISSHPRQPRILRKGMAYSWRMSTAFMALFIALLFTGTIHSQSALPGDSFYPWKRTSEQVWRAVSLDPVSVDINLANRRLNEWIVVADDPSRSTGAMNNYLEVLSRLKSNEDVDTLAVIVPALRSQKRTLNDEGLSSSQLDDYLKVTTALLPPDTSAAVAAASPTRISTGTPTKTLVRTPTAISTSTSTLVPTSTLTSTPTATFTSTSTSTVTATFTLTSTSTATATITVAPTDVPTDTPTVTVTEVPTETPTDIPTEVPTVIPTAIPTDTATDIPTEVVPASTEIPNLISGEGMPVEEVP